VLPNQIIARRLPSIREVDEFVRVCAWCKRAKLDDDWLLLSQAGLDATAANSISHTVCPDCSKAVDTEPRDPNTKH
jgi:hypothetical protein